MNKTPNSPVLGFLNQALLTTQGDEKELLTLVIEFFKNQQDHVPNLKTIREALGLEMIFSITGFVVNYVSDGSISIKNGVFSTVTIGNARTEKRNWGNTYRYEAALLRLPRPVSLEEMKHLVRSIGCNQEWKLARIDHLPDAAITNEQFQSRGPVIALGSMVKAGHGWTAPCVKERGYDSDWTRDLMEEYFADQQELPIGYQYLIVRKKS